MQIHFGKLEKRGFKTEILKNSHGAAVGIDIYPIDHKDTTRLIELLETEYGIGGAFAGMVLDDLHVYQVLTALRS